MITIKELVEVDKKLKRMASELPVDILHNWDNTIVHLEVK